MVKVQLHTNACFLSNFRGTKNFEILVSDDLSSWTQNVAASLAEVTSVTSCGPTLFFLASATVKARYLRFRDNSYYVNGPALAYLKVLAPGSRNMPNMYSSVRVNWWCKSINAFNFQKWSAEEWVWLMPAHQSRRLLPKMRQLASKCAKWVQTSRIVYLCVSF